MAKAKKKVVKKEAEVAETCSTTCGPCKFCSWILPIVIIALVWLWPADLWSKIVITIAAAFLLFGKHCPCHKKEV